MFITRLFIHEDMYVTTENTEMDLLAYNALSVDFDVIFWFYTLQIQKTLGNVLTFFVATSIPTAWFSFKTCRPVVPAAAFFLLAQRLLVCELTLPLKH